ncbi:hypothetical protein JDV09_05165 [Mycobacterium sp. Y57]|uniref:hypothetical protein n=1 Tax=Mycolicibacterium xanthum TaxID=2796469 RepID=UPI001C85ACCE|nr:hypothetical protein [Mycolicibacterium xanthum]MBX7431500.1 hypothetical protein [Mycolicibacterium xanthum]
MMRAVLALWAALTLAPASLVTAAVTHAGPPPPCTFTLSAPQLVQADGTTVVTATVMPADCGPPAAPYRSIACLQFYGDTSRTVCNQAGGADTAHVFMSPYVPGTTYSATGRGCGRWIGQEPAPDCQLLGPINATL